MSMMETLLRDWFLLDVVNSMPSAAELATAVNVNAFSVQIPAMLKCKAVQYAVKCCEMPEDKLAYINRVLLPEAQEKPESVVMSLRANHVSFLRDIATVINSSWRNAMIDIGPYTMDIDDVSNVMAFVIHAKTMTNEINRELKEHVLTSQMVSTKALTNKDEWGVIDAISSRLMAAAMFDNCEESDTMAVKALTHLYHVAKFDTQQAIDKTIHEKAMSDNRLVFFGQNPARVIRPVYWRVWGTLPLTVDIGESFWMSEAITNLRKSGILP